MLLPLIQQQAEDVGYDLHMLKILIHSEWDEWIKYDVVGQTTHISNGNLSDGCTEAMGR